MDHLPVSPDALTPPYEILCMVSGRWHHDHSGLTTIPLRAGLSFGECFAMAVFFLSFGGEPCNFDGFTKNVKMLCPWRMAVEILLAVSLGRYML